MPFVLPISLSPEKVLSRAPFRSESQRPRFCIFTGKTNCQNVAVRAATNTAISCRFFSDINHLISFPKVFSVGVTKTSGPAHRTFPPNSDGGSGAAGGGSSGGGSHFLKKLSGGDDHHDHNCHIRAIAVKDDDSDSKQGVVVPATPLAAQQRATLYTTGYLLGAVALALGSSLGGEAVVRMALGRSPRVLGLPGVGSTLFGSTVLSAMYQFFLLQVMGGGYVAQSMGGKAILPTSQNGVDREVMSVVQEAAVDSRMPTPQVYLIPTNEINAFATGLSTKKAAIGITRGALTKLSRDELLAVLGHEFGHIKNSDMQIGTELGALVGGFYSVIRMGFRILENRWYFGPSLYRRSRNDENDDAQEASGQRGGLDPIVLVGLTFLVVGGISWVGGTILKNMASREREYLADASSVQYVHKPEALANALRKIERDSARGRGLPRLSSSYSHLYFDDPRTNIFDFVFATHPPIQKRIERLETWAKAEKLSGSHSDE